MQNETEEILDNTFRLCSYLRDYIGDSSVNKRLAEIYYLLAKKEKIYTALISDKDTLSSAKNYFDYLYYAKEVKCSKQELAEAIQPILAFMFPDGVKRKKSEKGNSKRAAIAKRIENDQQSKTLKVNIKVLNCRTLYVFLSNREDFRVNCDPLIRHYFDVTDDAVKKDGDSIVNIDLRTQVKNQSFEIYLPLKLIKNIDINFSGKKMFIIPDYSSGRKDVLDKICDEMNVTIHRGKILAYGSLPKLTVKQRTGSFETAGKIEEFTFAGEKAKLKIVLLSTESGKRKCAIDLKQGSADINVFPIGNNIIKAKGECSLKKMIDCYGGDVDFDLLIKKGHIKVH